MPNLLAIDTTTEACSVALLFQNKIHEKFAISPRQHGTLILPWIDQLLSDAHIALAELDGLVVTRGPGSFTGVRLGIAVAQGLALATNLPIFPVSTLQVLAQSAWREQQQPAIFAALDARMGEIYHAGFILNEKNLMIPITPEQLSAPSVVTLPAEKTIWYGAGSGFDHYPDILPVALHLDPSVIFSKCFPHAQDALAYYVAAECVTAASLIPVYLRDNVTTPAKPML